MPAHTPTGWAVLPIPPELHELLRAEAARAAAGRPDPESAPGAPLRYPSEALDARALGWFQGEVERWAGVPVEPVGASGVRMARRGAREAPRLGDVGGEVFSAILAIEAEGEADWPFSLDEASPRPLAPGQLLLVEGARIRLSRPVPFAGRARWELALHYRPVGWAERAPELRARVEEAAHRVELSGMRAQPPGVVELLGPCLTRLECAHLIALATAQLEALATVGATEHEPHPARVGEGAWLAGPDPVLARVEALASRITGRPVAHQETLHVIRYRPGGLYRPHFDAFDAESSGGRRALEIAGQRTDTVLFYLDEGCAGGETVFPRLGLSVTPSRGHAIRWRNTWRGQRLELSLHEGRPVLSGEKWVATVWVRERPFRR